MKSYIELPSHLRDCAVIKQMTNDGLTLQCRCRCGCEAFFPYTKALSKEDQSTIRKLDKQVHRQIGLKSVYGEIDKNGQPKTYVKYLWGLIKKEIRIPEYPIGASINSVKIKCCDCSSEYIIFDNRYHGYNACTTPLSSKDAAYQIQFQKSEQPSSILINLEYADDINDAEEFLSISIYAQTSNKRKLLLSEETA